MARYYASAFGSIAVLLCGCYKLPVEYGGKESVRGRESQALVRTEASTEGGVSGPFSSSSGSEQSMGAPTDSTISGSRISVSPGALSVDTSIQMDEAAPVATTATTAELGLSTSFQSSGVAVSVQTSVPMDALQPFTLSLPLPLQSNLTNSTWDNLVVFYRVTKVDENKVVSGVIPRSEITVEYGVAKIKSRYFGSFQAAVTTSPVTQAKEAESQAVILTKAASSRLPAIAVTSRVPFLAHEGETVVINGTNFRSTMILAFGGKKVEGLKVASDVSASFVAPKVDGFGLTHLTAEQDGYSLSISMFYAGGSADLPVITEAESEVCSGKQYYDANGVVRTGSKSCVSGSSYAACSSDGQTGCITTSSYPAANKAAISSWDLRLGKTIAGVSGSFDLPRNMADTGTFDRLTGSGSVSGLDIYDSIDDFNNNGGFPTSAASGVTAFSGANWALSFHGDDGSGGGVASNGLCDGSEVCVYTDKISGRSWARSDGISGSFETGVSYCENLALGGASDWRLPTQKEMMQAYVDGIWLQKSGLNLVNGFEYQSSSTYSFDSLLVHVMDLSVGYVNTAAKATSHYTICVR